MKYLLSILLVFTLVFSSCSGDAVRVFKQDGGGGGGTSCFDVDGDGFFRLTSICPSGNDCDDRNALVNPGVDEILGNGIDDNCVNGVDESIFDDDGLLLYLSFDADLMDSSLFGRTINTVNTPVFFTTGVENQAASFNGGYLNAGSWDIAGNEMTIMSWVKFATLDSGGTRIVSKASSPSAADHLWMLGEYSSNWRSRLNGETIISPNSFSTNQWYHVAMVYDGSNWKMIVDGTEIISRPLSGLVNQDSTIPVLIGSNIGGYGIFNGLMDELYIFERALTIEEISSFANIELPTCADSPLVGTSCNIGIGACMSSGTYYCVDQTSSDNPVCDAIAGTPSEEICENEIDEDCNGADAICTPSGELSFEYIQLPDSYPKPYGKFIGDLSGDGFADLIVGDADGAGITWYEYPSWNTYSIRTSGSWGEDLQVADVDGDGNLDIIAAKRVSGAGIKWYENPLPLNPRTATWTEHNIYSTSTKVHDLEVADLNNDGLLDVMIRFEKENLKAPYVFLQTGSGWQLVTNIAYDSSMKGEGTGLGDIDGDGDIDSAHNGFWLENDGTGTSWTKHTFASMPEQMMLRVFDLNNDGDNEIIATPQSSGIGKLAYYTSSNPTGSWQEHIIVSPVDRMHGLEIGDFDLDGYLDISTSYRSDKTGTNDEIAVYLNDASSIPSFTKVVVATSGSHFHKIGDLGSDGDLDIFGVNWQAGSKPDIWENHIIE